jgi:hypothetical protein
MGKNQRICEAVQTAGNLAVFLSFITGEFKDLEPTAMLAMAKEYDPIARRLGDLLEDAAVCAALSLANTHPVNVGGGAYRSYAEGVYQTARHVLGDIRQAPQARDRDPIPMDLAVHCEKEYERATGEAMPTDSMPNIGPETRKVLELSAEGMKPADIAVRLGMEPKQVRDARSRYKKFWQLAKAG